MPSCAERADRRAGLRVERDEPIAGRDVENALVALAVGPVRDAAARQLARRGGGALPFAQLCTQISSPVLRVERDDRAARAGGRVEHAVDHERRALRACTRDAGRGCRS